VILAFEILRGTALGRVCEGDGDFFFFSSEEANELICFSGVEWKLYG
jgi:hypothetical protein